MHQLFSKSLERGEVTEGRKFSPLENSPVATAIGLRTYSSCLKSDSPKFIAVCEILLYCLFLPLSVDFPSFCCRLS